MINRAADKRGVAMTSNLQDEVEFSRWAQRLVGELTPIRERFTPFPLYFQTQIFNFVVMRRLLREYFPFDRPHESVLEIGCGVGAHSLLLSRFATRLLGVDIPGEYAGYLPPNFKSSVEVSRALVNEMYGITNATFDDAFPNRLPCEADSVDLIFSWTVLEHIPNLRESYAEMLRVLKPGGVMIHVAPVTMSAIATIASVNVEEAKKRAMAPAALGWLGAARMLWSNYGDLARGRPDTRRAGMVIPHCHSEFLTDYQDQLTLYTSWNYIHPMIDLGFVFEDQKVVNDFNFAIVARKPG
jgi:SAM-dependent methyltransferase